MGDHEATDVFDLAILGGGPGGYVAALTSARLGVKTALIEQERVGGTCLNIGCIPTKALTTATDLLVRGKRASDYGVSISSVGPDLPAMMAYKQTTVDDLVGGVEMLLRERQVTLIHGRGDLIAPDRLRVSLQDGSSREVSTKRLILAPGSITARPPIPGLDLPGVISSTEALQITDIPERLVVVGGGVIGLEFACIYEALGSRVTVLEMMPTLLPGATDETLAKRVGVMLRRRGMAIHTRARVEVIESAADGLMVRFEGPKGLDATNGDRVLVAAGRWPNTADLSLKEMGINLNGRAIAVDEQLATSAKGVWAIGDAVGGWMLAHKAMVEGRIAAANALGGERSVEYRSVPNVIFTRPEIASVGFTEAQARELGHEITVSHFPFSAVPKARILGEAEGLVKLVCEAVSGRVLGVHILGPHATDLIAEGALAIQLGATADDLAWTTHAHPTLPEAMLEAALGVSGAAIHFHTRRGASHD